MKTLIIAEAGVNHNGDIDIAKRMIDTAKECNVDIIKFQTAIPSLLVSKYAEKAVYQKANTGNNDSQLEMLKKICLKWEEFDILYEYCIKRDIIFLSTPFDLESIEYLLKFNMPFWKIPSGEVTNYPYLKKIGQLEEKVMMSTGMCSMSEIEQALQVLKEEGCTDITLLHCNTEYPTPYRDVNLRAIKSMHENFGIPVGYSDHTKGIEASIAAVALGATVVEKHFTLDRTMEGPDHKASLEPNELAAMVYAIRNVEEALGDGIKKPTASEKKNISIARKSIIAKNIIHKGELFTENNITVKRPGNGISPMNWNMVLGMRAKRDFQEDELIEI